MKVCAHASIGPRETYHFRADSTRQALDRFAQEIQRRYQRSHLYDQHLFLDLYPQCTDCRDLMNFHDGEITRYVIGPRGALRRAA
ncbi:hypothetical protein ACQPW1_10240 [Nocardia sp. CA-128927]|uniref:hypothetical protein n=1 Tax=Nocardia sp. CA-128927 TaxID=3239975 RepID=UPI003D96E075